MSRTHLLTLGRIAGVLASSTMLLVGGSALAQTVRTFDDAPSIEQLRSIMTPEVRPGAGRSIVIQRVDVASPSTSVQHASTQVLAPREPTAAPVASKPPIAQTAANVSVPHPAPPRDTAGGAEAVAFHINFGFNSAALPDSAHQMIDRMAELMKESPEVKVRVEGHTDAVGSPDYNISLSDRRALSVAEYLVKQGVEPSRLVVIGKGMAEPLTKNRFDPANRRVQFVRIS